MTLSNPEEHKMFKLYMLNFGAIKSGLLATHCSNVGERECPACHITGGELIFES